MIIFHKIIIDGKAHYREFKNGVYGEAREDEPQEIKIEEVIIDNKTINDALGAFPSRFK